MYLHKDYESTDVNIVEWAALLAGFSSPHSFWDVKKKNNEIKPRDTLQRAQIFIKFHFYLARFKVAFSCGVKKACI